LRTSLHPYPTYKPTHNQSYKRTYTLHTCPTPTYLHCIPTYLHWPCKPTKPYIPTLSRHTYTTPTTTTLHFACRPYHYTPAPRAGSQMLRLRFDSEGILCAANFIGEITAFKLMSLLRASCGRKGCWIPTKICNSGRLHNHYHRPRTCPLTKPLTKQKTVCHLGDITQHWKWRVTSAGQNFNVWANLWCRNSNIWH